MFCVADLDPIAMSGSVERVILHQGQGILHRPFPRLSKPRKQFSHVVLKDRLIASYVEIVSDHGQAYQPAAFTTNKCLSESNELRAKSEVLRWFG
jgi:hypothetical protein